MLGDSKRSSSIVIAPIGIGSCPKSDSKGNNNIQKEITELPIPKILPLSQRAEIDYPEIWNIESKLKNLR